MKTSKYLVFVLALATLVVSGCSLYRPVNQPSGSAINFQFDRKDFDVIGRASGKACAQYLFGSIPLAGENTYDKAVQAALATSGGDWLIQSTTDEQLSGFPHPAWMPIVSQHCMNVTGVAIKFKK